MLITCMHNDGATPWATRAMAWGVGTFSGMVPIYILDLALVAAPIYFLPKMSKGPTSPKQACGHRGCAKRTSSPWLRPVACTATTSSPLASLSYLARRLTRYCVVASSLLLRVTYRPSAGATCWCISALQYLVPYFPAQVWLPCELHNFYSSCLQLDWFKPTIQNWIDSWI
jgi:hypothetical protein